jgi:hypothetical protein
MALFTQQFGIKEVADVAFYNQGDVIYDPSTGSIAAKDGNVKPVLVFDTLKTSSLEFTGETTEARGGKGNAVLMSWDHSREATLTLEDALLSADSLATMLSNKKASATGPQNTVISIDANGFPGTYTVIGKTYARGVDGRDHLLTFLIFKAKVSAEANFEMSADGDPSTLNMTLKVLRCTNSTEDLAMGAVSGDMVKMIIDQNEPAENPANDKKTPDIEFPGVKKTTTTSN